jgi:hypothetical protein
MKKTPEEVAAIKARIEAERAAEIDYLMAVPDFKAWPKIGRLNRNIIITEKLDGTNAAVVIWQEREPDPFTGKTDSTSTGKLTGRFEIAAQSRTRMLAPGRDNAGFGQWVQDNKDALIYALGEGTHFGEWWGKGIQRGYGAEGKTFSLFNTFKWFQTELGHPWQLTEELQSIREQGVAISVVPVLYEGPWMNVIGFKDEPESRRMRFVPEFMIEWLRKEGSIAAPGHAAEGIVVFHAASGSLFKATIDNDGSFKSAK